MKWMTTDQAAEYLGMSKGGIYGLTHQNKIPFYKLGKGRIRFTEEDLDEWLKTGKVNSTNENQIAAEKCLEKMKQRAV